MIDGGTKQTTSITYHHSSIDFWKVAHNSHICIKMRVTQENITAAEVREMKKEQQGQHKNKQRNKIKVSIS